MVVQEDQQAAAVSAATARVGRGGRTSRLLHADMAACATTGQFLLALCGDDTPITVYTVTNALDSQERAGSPNVKLFCSFYLNYLLTQVIRRKKNIFFHP